MKLDTKAIRYLTSDDWRVLNAVSGMSIVTKWPVAAGTEKRHKV